jgi:S1-C subfamily serine protease
LLVREVEEGSPAATAGIAKGDLIAEAAGQPTRGVDDLFDALASAQGAIDLKVIRGTEERSIHVVFAPTGPEPAEDQGVA